jgi:hypothetical protein
MPSLPLDNGVTHENSTEYVPFVFQYLFEEIYPGDIFDSKL